MNPRSKDQEKNLPKDKNVHSLFLFGICLLLLTVLVLARILP